MRISDWSSDVCSSDLWVVAGVALLAAGLIACGGSDDGGSAEDSAMSSAGRGETTGNSIAPSGAQLSDGSAGGGDEKGGFPSSGAVAPESGGAVDPRSEEHTAEIQSLIRISYASFCLKKKQKIKRE